MKKMGVRKRSVALAATALLGSGAWDAASASSCHAVSPPHTVALVELYTSQGCSSCPPADRWLSKLEPGTAPLLAIPLALHVSYWDYIGWKDPFARKEFTQRQSDLASHNGSGSVYTPEVFVGARELADWHDARRYADAVAKVNERAPRARIELQAHWLKVPSGAASQRLAVQVRWSADASAREPQLLLAVKRGGYMTDVQAGENRGETLRNDHVARVWSGPFTPGPQALTTELSVPAAPGEATLVAFAQDRASGTVLQAMELPLAACEAAPGLP